jgi:hypothetical protein
MGPMYEIESSQQRQTGDPMQQIVEQLSLREPPGYEHPQRLGSDVLQPGGPRVLPVSQKIQHGPEQSCSEAFDREAREAAAVLHTAFGMLGWRDRRFEGRRFRPTDLVAELDGPQEPYPAAPAPADLPIEAFGQGWLSNG